MVDKFLLSISSLNMTDDFAIITHLMTEWHLDISKSKITKSFFLELQEEMDTPHLEKRFQSLAKLLLIFMHIPSSPSTLLTDHIEDLFQKPNINDAFEYGMLISLVSNLRFFFSLYIKFPKDSITLKRSRLLLFIKFNVFLISSMLFLLRFKRDMKRYIKLHGEDLEEIILKFIKISITYKYTPARNLLCLYYIYFRIYISEEMQTGEEETCRKVEKKEKYLTKQNYSQFLKKKTPLIFENVGDGISVNYVEKFYRKNLVKNERPELERVIIVQILKILLATFKKNAQTNHPEYIKDYIPIMLLKKYYIDKNIIQIKEEDDELTEEIISEIVKNFTEEERDYYQIVDILIKLDITAVIISFYYAALKALQKNNLIQYSVFAYHLKDSNGLFVFLKILSQDFPSQEEQYIESLGDETLSAFWNELNEYTMLYNLKLIGKIALKNNEYIYNLVECKVPIMLKKILAHFEKNEGIKRNCLKLFKYQLKFFDKNWRIDNSNIITSIYLNLEFDEEESENYLERKDKNFKEVNSEFFNEEELKKVHQEFHEYNYLQYINHPEEFERFRNEKMLSRYSRIYQALEKRAEEQSNQSKDNNNININN